MIKNRFSRIVGVVAIACSILVAVPASDASARIEPGDISTLQAGGGNRQMEIGYNPDRDEYLAAWHTDTSSSPETSIYGVILGRDGKPKGTPVRLARNPPTGATGLLSPADWWRPDVSYNPATKQYLVTLLRNPTAPGQRNHALYGILVSDTGAAASGEVPISDPLGESVACLAEFPDAVADPTTGGYKLVYSRVQTSNKGGCEGLFPESEFKSAVVIQSLSGTLVRGPRVDVPIRSIYAMAPLIAYNPVTKNFLVTHSAHAGVYDAPTGHANIYDSALNRVGATTQLARISLPGDDASSYAFPIADPVSGNWVVLYVTSRYRATQMNVLSSTGVKLSDTVIPYRGSTSALSAIGDGSVLASNGRGPLQQLRQDGTEIHQIDTGLALLGVFVANGNPDDARAVGIGYDPTTSDTASVGVRIFAPGPLPLPPARLLDTRGGPAPATIDGQFSGGGKQATGTFVELTVNGRGDVPADAAAVLLNVTAAGTSAVGFVTAYPCDAATRPTTSNLNFAAGGAASSAAISKVSATGTVCFYTSAQAHLIVDVNGYVPKTASVAPLVPARLLDTRSGGITTDGKSQAIGRVTSGSTTTLTIAGRAGVDATADAVLVTVTAIRPAQTAFLTVYPCDAARPTAANLNAPAGGNVANLVTSKVSAAGTICVFSSVATDLAVDVAAFVPDNGGLLSIVPARLVDTRDGATTIDGESQGQGRVDADSTTQVRVTRGDVPQGATGVMLNVAAIRPDDGGYMTVFPYPCDGTRPQSSNVNFARGAVVSNAVFVKVGVPVPDGYVCIYTSAKTDLAVDVVGYTVDS